MPKNRDLELLYEIGCLRFVPRVWKQFLGMDTANLAEHHFRVIWLSLLLAKMEGGCDEAKVLKMAMVHDVCESRTGDLHHISRQYVKRDEYKAIDDVLASTSLGPEMAKLWREYEERKNIEAKIVKDADFLDVDLEIHEQEAIGRKHLAGWHKQRKIVSKRFYTKSAKKLWKEIQNGSPTSWFDNARSRYTEGDMKPGKHN